MSELSSLFEIDLGSADKITLVLEQAHEALATASVESLVAARGATPASDSSVGGSRMKRPSTAVDREPITGLPTWAWAECYLDEQLRQASQNGEALGVMVAEIDRFGEHQASLGPAQTAALLQAVSLALGSRLRKNDVVAYDGEGRFLFVLPETTGAGVIVVAERTRKLVNREEIVVGKGRSVQATLSLGCATFEAGVSGSATEILALAREAVATARKAGGNQVTALEPALDAQSGLG